MGEGACFCLLAVVVFSVFFLSFFLSLSVFSF